MNRRFNRNILIDGFGEEGQRKLKAAKVLVIGAGGLGSPVLYYLAAAGVGTLGIIDHDCVDETNLQRQIIHFSSDIGQPKVISAAEKLNALYPDIIIDTHLDNFTEKNGSLLVDQYDFIVDCCDNYETKFLINDICVSRNKAYSHGAVLSLQGEIMTYTPGAACYRCVFDTPPQNGEMPTSKDIGILGAIAGVIGSLQATEVIKYLTGIGSLLVNRILIFDGKTMSFNSLTVEKNKYCSCSFSGF